MPPLLIPLVHRLPAAFRQRLPWLTKAFVAVLVCWLLGWLALPLALKPQLEQRASEALGRPVTIERIRFHPWSLEWEVTGLRIGRSGQSDDPKTPDQTTPQSLPDNDSQLSVQRIYVDAEFSSLLRWAPVLDSVQIDRPVLNLRHLGRGVHDLQDVLDKLTASSPTPPGRDNAPARFAVYNIELRDGQINLHDAPEDNHHRLTDITLAVPFISTLGTTRDVRVSPKLAFKLNGSAFETTADTQPFDDSLTTEAKLTISDFVLTPYLDYLPKNLPARPTQGTLDAELALRFSQQPQPQVSISGHVSAADVTVTDTRQQPLLKLARAEVVLKDLRPLERTALLESIELNAPDVLLQRDASGLLNTQGQSTESIATNPIAKSVVAGQSIKSEPAAATPPQANTAWTVAVSAFKLTGGQLRWSDALMPDAQQQPARLQLAALDATATRLRWPLPTQEADATSFEASARLAGPAVATTKSPAEQQATKTRKASANQKNGRNTASTAATAKPSAATPPAPPDATLAVKGSLLAHRAEATASVQTLDLALFAPYVRPHLVPTANGQLSLQAQARWVPGRSAANEQTGTADELELTLQQLGLDNFSLKDDQNQILASLQNLSVRDAQMRPLARAANLGNLTLTRPFVPMQRDPQGRWMYASWLKTPATALAASPTQPFDTEATPVAAATTSSNYEPWTWQLRGLTVADGQFDWLDSTTTPAVKVQARGVNAKVQQLASRGGQPAEVSTSLRWSADQGRPGTLDWRGTLSLGEDGQSPILKGTVNALRLPVHTLAPYAADQLNLTLQRADASYAGNLSVHVTPAGTTTQLAGDFTLENFRADTLPGTHSPAQEWLRWQTINLRGLDVKLSPQAPAQVHVERGALNDFFARVAIDETGRINLQDIRRQPTTSAPPATSASAATAVTNSAAANAVATSAAAANSAATSTATTVAAPDASAPQLRIGPFSLVNGSVDFSDQFIRPNYRANLSELTGRIGGFSSAGAATRVDGQTAPEMAEVELRGKAEGTASLEITGKLNPLANPLALDIEGRVRDLELPPLSPYTIKYTGHGIERGKLSLDVNYTVLPNGQLTARNQLVLNQLTFGDPVPGAPASLPVKLATALLSDRQGVIDLNLPISGSLNDPEFSLLPVIFKIIGNVIVKAITAPFSLLASALGGSDTDLSTVAFAPGTAQLTSASVDALARVAKALADRPSLTLTVVGTASLEQERTAYQRHRLLGLVAAERARNTPTTPDALPALTADSADYPRWLTSLYKRTDMSKPRNALGFAQDLSVTEMEALLLTQIPVNEASMKELATQRGTAVRDQLVRLSVPVQRLFLGAPGATPKGDGAAPTAALAHLSLALR